MDAGGGGTGPGTVPRLCRVRAAIGQLAGGMLAKILAASRPRLRVLYISGYAGDAIVHHGVFDPTTHFIPKPFTPDALGRKVRAVLDDSADG